MENNDGVIILEGSVSESFMGYVEDKSGDYHALYDWEKLIELLCEHDGMERDDAIEFFDFNIAPLSHLGNGPVYFHKELFGE